MSEESTVYIVDADSLARRSMAEIARSKGLEVREYDSAERLSGELPSIPGRACLIADAVLAEPGLQLQHLHKNGKSLPTVAVGPHDVRIAVRSMQQGAVTFLSKPCDPQELSAAIDAALERASQQQQAGQIKADLRQLFEQLTASE